MLPALVYVFFGCCACCLNGFFSFNSIKQALLLVIPPLCAILFYGSFRDNSKLPIYIFLGIALANIPAFFSFSITDYAESQYAFIYGGFLILFILEKRWKYVALCLILFIFAHKRIAIAACAFCIIVVLLFARNRKKMNHKDLKRSKLLQRLGCLAILLIPYTYIWMIDNSVLYFLFSRYSINTMGRVDMWRIFASYFNMSPGFYGQGIGWVFEKLAEIGRVAFNNLHNDLLATYLEIGFFGFLMWLLSYVYIAVVLSKKTDVVYKYFIIVAIGYTLINYFTDNIVIYVNYWFPLNLLLLYAKSRVVQNNISHICKSPT